MKVSNKIISESIAESAIDEENLIEDEEQYEEQILAKINEAVQ
ncbi:MAG: hypothetical protein OEV66_12055 [Spirochaetia bacterium]|nr:hypothetical protein [Spirochaetia bacterium]